MKKSLFAFVLGAAVAAAIYHWWLRPSPVPGEAPPPAPVTEAPAPHYPVAPPEGAQTEPLPPLEESDLPLRQRLAAMIGVDTLSAIFQLDDIVRRFVITIDNLPGRQLPQRYLPLRNVPGRFLVKDQDGLLLIDEANAARYRPTIRALEAMETRDLVAVYRRYYPLFQEAYEQLGYPDGYFNNRLIEVIDHLLKTPEVPDPIDVLQPNVLYIYGDPELEARSAGQKLLVRLGLDQQRQVKARLREIRAALTQPVDPARE